MKRIRQSERRTARNRRNKSLLRRQIKQFRRALAAGNLADAQKLWQPTISLIDRSIQKGVLHPNAADRYKSRLTQHYNSLQTQSAAR